MIPSVYVNISMTSRKSQSVRMRTNQHSIQRVNIVIPGQPCCRVVEHLEKFIAEGSIAPLLPQFFSLNSIGGIDVA